jgi:hypothetical protein
VSLKLSQIGPSMNTAALEMGDYEARQIDAAVRLLVALGGEGAVRQRVVRERHDRIPAKPLDLYTPSGTAPDMPLNTLVLDSVRVWEGGYDGTNSGWTWRERWLHER